jgi:septal ring-binding cell division protein DamX
MEDQAQSLDGRISNISPFSQIGSNNVIHGPQWLARQPAESFVIQVAAVADRKDLYAVAERYNHYLKDELSWYAIKSSGSERFVLLSGGYGGEREAATVLRRLPRYVNFQRPVIARMGDIQQRL